MKSFRRLRLCADMTTRCILARFLRKNTKFALLNTGVLIKKQIYVKISVIKVNSDNAWQKADSVYASSGISFVFFHFGLRITRTSSHNPAEPFQKNKRYTLVILDSFIFLPFASARGGTQMNFQKCLRVWVCFW